MANQALKRTNASSDDHSPASTATSPTYLLPVFLKLAGRKVVLVGGGQLASAKLPALVGARARVTVVAPQARPDIVLSGAHLVRRGFAPGDLDGAWLAIAAATPEVNREVARAAEARGIFVVAVDDPRSASAYTGGVVRRGGVTIAVSTEGEAPALAGLLREALEAVLPDELATWVEEAGTLRRRQRAEGLPISDRRPLLLQALNRLYAAKAVTGGRATARGPHP